MTEFRQDDFFTRDLANDGRRVMLLDKLRRPTQAWVQVRGRDSDAYQLALVAYERRKAAFEVGCLAELAEKKEGSAEEKKACAQAVQTKRDAFDLAEGRKLTAALVSAWCFPEECTAEAVDTFLQRAPQNISEIDRWGLARERFFGSEQSSSSDSQSRNSDSEQSQKDQDKQSEPA